MGLEKIHTAVGIIGNVISFGLFASPVPTFYRIIKRKSVEEFQAYPYLFTVLNCLFWILYGLPVVHKDNILVLTINSIGLVIELIYLAIFIYYANDNKKRLFVGLFLGGEAIFFTAMVLAAILGFKFKDRAVLVGIICDVFNITMYASPLAIWKKVITTKSVEYMPFWLSVASLANGCCWTLFALLKFDIYILVSNGLGAIFGAIQLLLYAYYYFLGKRNAKEGGKAALEEGVKPSEVQLAKAS